MAEDRHKYKPVRFRPPESDLLWLLEHSKASGRAVNAVLADALAQYRASLSGPTASGPTTSASGPTTEKKRPQRSRAQEVPPPPDVVEEAIVPLERKPTVRPPRNGGAESASDIAAFFRGKR